MKSSKLLNRCGRTCFLPFALILFAGTAFATPKLKVDNSTFDFGTVSEGTTVDGNFTLRNTGDAPLEIQRIQPACGCTVPTVNALTLQPGEEKSLVVKFDTSGFAGEKAKTVRLYTNEVDSNTSVVTLRGTVKTELDVEPIRVYFGEIRKASTPSRSFVVTSDANRGIEILKVASRSANMTLTVDDFAEGSKRGKRVTVTLKTEIPIGNFRGRVVLKTTSKREPIVNVNVFAKVIGDVELLPAEASFGLVEAPMSKPAVRTVQIRNRTAVPLSVRSIENTNPQFEAKVKTLTPGALYEIQITLLSQVTGVVRSRVQVLTDHPDPDQKTIEIPVYAVVNRKSE